MKTCLPCYSRSDQPSWWMEAEVCFYCWLVAQDLTLFLVGTIQHEADLSTETWSSGPPDITPLTPMLIPSEVEHESANRMVSLESQPPLRLEFPLKSLPDRVQEVTTGAGGSNGIQESIAIQRDTIPDGSSNSARDSTREHEVSNRLRLRLTPLPFRTPFVLIVIGIDLGRPWGHHERGI